MVSNFCVLAEILSQNIILPFTKTEEVITMQIKAVKLYEGGEFNEEFLFGGENKADGR